jgi:hypothetical protein
LPEPAAFVAAPVVELQRCLAERIAAVEATCDVSDSHRTIDCGPASLQGWRPHVLDCRRKRYELRGTLGFPSRMCARCWRTIHGGEVRAVAVRTVERTIVAAIVTTVPMIDSTIEWSTLPLTVVPPLIRHQLPPGADGFKQLR